MLKGLTMTLLKLIVYNEGIVLFCFVLFYFILFYCLSFFRFAFVPFSVCF